MSIEGVTRTALLRCARTVAGQQMHHLDKCAADSVDLLGNAVEISQHRHPGLCRQIFHARSEVVEFVVDWLVALSASGKDRCTPKLCTSVILAASLLLP